MFDLQRGTLPHNLKVIFALPQVPTPQVASLWSFILILKWREKKDKPTALTTFLFTSNNQKVFDIIRRQKLIKSSPAEKKIRRNLRATDRNPWRSEAEIWGVPSINPSCSFVPQNILCWAEQLQTQTYILLFLNQNFKMCHLQYVATIFV